eukprot:symbB.v1.2.021055.t1/scaffold1800.1/size100811/7
MTAASRGSAWVEFLGLVSPNNGITFNKQTETDRKQDTPPLVVTIHSLLAMPAVPALILAVAAVKCLAECQTEESNLLSLHGYPGGGRHHGHVRRRHHYGHYGTNSDVPMDTVEDFLGSGDSSAPVACYYSKKYVQPSTFVQEASDDISEMESRCSDAGETYVNNDDEATCILDSDTGGYDYSEWISSSACPYPAGAAVHLGHKKRRDIKFRVKVG